MNTGAPFYGKIMLFGEYSVILGSKALVMPLKRFSGQWSYEKCVSPSDWQMREELHKYASFLQSRKNMLELVDAVKLVNDIREGLWFRANIPQGYGAGSSGALVAAVYDSYKLNCQKSPKQLKLELGLMEGYFHGSSSGIDPLCCYFREPLLIEQDEQLHILNQKLTDLPVQLHLFDSAQIGMTAPLVDFFRNQLKAFPFYKKTRDIWIPAVNSAIEQFLHGDTNTFKDSLKTLSVFEREHLLPMIPESVAKKWDLGLTSEAFTMKLCGSGGGGFFLVFSDQGTSLDRFFEAKQLIQLH